MTHFVRYAVIGAIVAGASVYTFAQDDDLDALLEGLSLDEEQVMLEDDATVETIEEEPTIDEISVDEEVASEEEPIVEDELIVEDEEPLAEDELIVEDEEPLAEDELVVEDEEPVAEDEDVIDEEPVAEEEVVVEDEELSVEEDDTIVEEPTVEDETLVVEDEPQTPSENEEEIVVPNRPGEMVRDEMEKREGLTSSDTDEDVESSDGPLVDDLPEEDVEDTVEDATEETTEEESLEALLAGADENTEDVEALTEEERAYNELDALLRMTNEGYDRHAYESYEAALAIMRKAPKGNEVDPKEYYAPAIKKFQEAAESIRNEETKVAFKERCAKYASEAAYRTARVYFERGENKLAEEALQDELARRHPQAETLAAMVKEALRKKLNEGKEPDIVLPEYAKDEHKDERLVVAERLKRATIYYQLSKYTEANNQIELVLRDDPNNLEAIALRKRLNLRHADRNRALKMSTHAKMINDVEANWTPTNALGVESEEFHAPQATTAAKTPVDEQGKRDAEIIRNKLETIRLPEFSIAPPSTIADAVPLFAELAKLYDKPDLPPEERGISFVLNATTKTSTTTSSDDSEDDDWGSTDDTESGNGLKTLPPVNLTYVTLKDALDMVCEVSGFTYTIRGRTVLLVPPGTVSRGEFQTRKYHVMQDAIQKLVQASNEMAEGAGGGGGEDDWGGTDASDFGDSFGGSVSPDVLKQTFQNLGVPFTDDAKIFYLSTVGKLHVTNTPENLALVENILEEYNVTPFQIEVEARFVEVSQSDLNSLGFEWRLNSDLLGTIGDGIDWASSAFTGAGKTSAGGTNGQGAKVFRGFGPDGTGNNNLAIHGGANAFNQGTRFLGDSGLYANRVNLTGNSLPVDDTFLSFSAVFGELDMTMILHMLAQRSDTDMLSSPKVLAKNEEEALIRVVTEWIYPTEFEIQELDNDNNNNNWNNDNNNGGGQIANQPPPVKFAVEPSSFEKQEVGVKLQVIPRVLPEGQMIELFVEPTVVEYLGDFEYGMQIPYVKGVTESLLSGTTENEIGYYQVSMPQPKFHFREVRTKLSVYNGATVVLGGLITETRKSFEDKVPFFGDLPFIGFLFRSSGEYSEKRNLLIFISARLVDPAGRPIKMATDGRIGAQDVAPAEVATMGEVEE